MNNDSLVMFTVYNSPADYPGEFVIRRHFVGPGGKQSVEVGLFARGDSLENVRSKLPGGLYNLSRYPDDSPSIVETWI